MNAALNCIAIESGIGTVNGALFTDAEAGEYALCNVVGDFASKRLSQMV
jgi:hypothetical protein